MYKFSKCKKKILEIKNFKNIKPFARIKYLSKICVEHVKHHGIFRRFLKSSNNPEFLYLKKSKSGSFPIKSRCFVTLNVWELHEQETSHFFSAKVSFTKALSKFSEASRLTKNLDGTFCLDSLYQLFRE